MTVDVNRHDGLCLRRNHGFYLIDIHAPRIGIAIDDHGLAARLGNCLRTGYDRETGQNYFAALWKIEGLNRQLQCNCPITDSYAMLHPAVFCPLILKLGYKFSSGRNPTGLDTFAYVLQFFAVKERFIDRDHISHSFPSNSILSLSPA